MEQQRSKSEGGKTAEWFGMWAEGTDCLGLNTDVLLSRCVTTGRLLTLYRPQIS